MTRLGHGFFAGLAVLTAVILAAVTYKSTGSDYVEPATVYECDAECVTFETEDGNLWCWNLAEYEQGQYVQGQAVELLMNDSGTADVLEDDVILEVGQEQ